MRSLPVVTAAVLLFPCATTRGTAQTLTNAAAGRAPVAVPAAFDLTWAALARFVRGDLVHGGLIVVEEAAGYRKGRWPLDIPTTDFRAAGWAACQSGIDPATAPRGGVAEATIRGDSSASTVVVTVQWSGLGTNDEQRAMQCRTLGEYEKEAERVIRRQAERAARR